jgi:hypothetical protein
MLCLLQCVGCAAPVRPAPSTPATASPPALNLDVDLAPLLREAIDLPSDYTAGTIRTTLPPGVLVDQAVPLRYAAISARSQLQQSQIEVQILQYRTRQEASDQLARLARVGSVTVPGLGDQALLRAQRAPGQASETISFTRCGALASVAATARIAEDLISLDQLSLYAQELDILLERALCSR